MPLSATLCLWILSLRPPPLPTVSQASFGVGDTLLIVVVALIVFGPKKLPEISKQIGKLLYEFRKASNDFKFQIEEELRASEQAERQKQLQTQAATPQPATPVAITAGESVSAEPVAEAAPTAPLNPKAPVIPAAETAPANTSAAEAASQTHTILPPTIQPPASGLPISSRSPYRSIEDPAEEPATAQEPAISAPQATPVTAARSEALEEMQADAQEAVRSAAADPSYRPNGSQPEATTDPVPTHHG